jgi:hypothetical protein
VVRVCIRRALEWAGSIQTFPDALSFLRAISMATASLSRLVRIQEALVGSEFEQAFQDALDEVTRELDLLNPPAGDSHPALPSSSSGRPDPLSSPPDPGDLPPSGGETIVSN